MWSPGQSQVQDGLGWCVCAGPSGPDRPRAPGGGGRARRKSGIIMSELGAGLRVPGSNATVSPAHIHSSDYADRDSRLTFKMLNPLLQMLKPCSLSATLSFTLCRVPTPRFCSTSDSNFWSTDSIFAHLSYPVMLTFIRQHAPHMHWTITLKPPCTPHEQPPKGIPLPAPLVYPCAGLTHR